jgi:ATP-dependent Clp protease ATP-binding subunit ClpA
MFERYTERARRVIFFARYEASQFGSHAIETEHLLIGLLREDQNLVNRFLLDEKGESIRAEIEARATLREKVPTSIDMPLSEECRRILAYATEEAVRLNHLHIGTEHLLLGILREEKCMAAEILRGHGLRLIAIREELTRSVIEEVRTPSEKKLPEAGCVPDADTAIFAEAVWIPIHGLETINAQKPFRAELHGVLWIVSGSNSVKGYTLLAVVSKVNGTIVRLEPL